MVAGKGAGASDLLSLSLSRVADADVVKSIPHLDFPLSKVSHADEVIPDDVAGFRTLWEKSDAPVEHAPELVHAHEPALVGAAHESVSARAGAGSVAEHGTQTEHVSDTVHSPTSTLSSISAFPREPLRCTWTSTIFQPFQVSVNSFLAAA